MKTYKKTIWRMFRAHNTRFIALALIIALGICFVGGIGSLSSKILDSFNSDFKNQQGADVIVKSNSVDGISESQINLFNQFNFVENVFPFTMIESQIAEKNTRIYLYSFQKMEFNQLQLIEGNFPKLANECVIERSSHTLIKNALNQEINWMGKTYRVSGIVANPLMFSKEGDMSLTDQKNLDQIIYLEQENFPNFFPITDLYLKIENLKSFSIFSNKYRTLIENNIVEFKNTDILENLNYLSLNDNYSNLFLVSITDKVDVICLIFPIFFILVVGLVVLTTMTRLIEEERSSIGCSVTLGYSNHTILAKYLVFILTCSFLGMIMGNISGIFLLPPIIYPAFNGLFFLPEITSKINLQMGIISSGGMLLAIVFVTVYVITKELNEKPVSLLKTKSPKPGKKIFLERIPLVWNRISFTYKSTFRNIFRYLGRFFMVVVSVAGSTSLVMAGIGLRDVSKGTQEVAGFLRGMSDTILLISIVVIIFAMILCILVIYNLTNMNISERKREIATLKVLGYHDLEVGMYIYREILILSLIGIAFGIPLGIGILGFIFHYLDFGSLSGIYWYSYIIAFGVILISIFCVYLLVYSKIQKVEMNSSLKTLE